MGTFVASDPALEALVNDAKLGKAAAWTELYGFIRDTVVPRLYRRHECGLDPEDLLQDIMLRLFTTIAWLRQDESFVTYVFKIGRHIMIDNIRKYRRRHTRTTSEFPDIPVIDPSAAQLEQADFSGIIIPRLVVTLDKKETDLFHRIFVVGEDTQTIMSALRISEKCFRTRKHRLTYKLVTLAASYILLERN